jgi:hypothetical protein
MVEGGHERADREEVVSAARVSSASAGRTRRCGTVDRRRRFGFSADPSRLDVPVEDIDLMIASIPHPVLRDTYQWMTKTTCELDRELLKGLHSVGFETDFGDGPRQGRRSARWAGPLSLLVRGRRSIPSGFGQVLGQYPTGFCVVTAADPDGGQDGMAVGSLTSVSLDPSVVAFFPDKNSGPTGRGSRLAVRRA